MPKSEDFEEGVSTCIEQAILGRYTTTGMSRLISHYVNIGLATFLEFDFRKVLETRFMLDFLADVRVDELREEREQRRKWTYDRAFSDATRCFRGSGFLVNCKDLTYFNGNNYVWQFIELGLRNPQQLMVDLFESGKTDPLNPVHKTFLQFAANM